jgi:hypothetical protein
MGYVLLPRVPLSYRMAQCFFRWDVPGTWSAYRTLVVPHHRGRAAPFHLSDGSRIWMPLTWPGLVTGRGLTGYEPDAIRYFAQQIAFAPAPVTLIDCGADVGVFGRLVLAQRLTLKRLSLMNPTRCHSLC